MKKYTLVAILTFLNVYHYVDASENSREQVFSDIYKISLWGQNEAGEGTSGHGSTLASTVFYREFIQKFLEEFNIQSVVDLGCGDWEFSKAINWNGAEYTGIDVVPFLIERNQLKYGTSKIKFIHQDAVSSNLPSADLLICKDVLQHLSNEDIHLIIPQFKKFKYCLITNDTLTSQNEPFVKINCKIQTGWWRPVDLTQAPFFLKGEKILTFSHGADVKQVLLIINER